jgi:valyl-tRNA synthetase
VIGRDGRLLAVDWSDPTWGAADPASAQRAYDELAGKNVRQAQRRIVEMLAESGDLIGEPRTISHPVKFFEKGDRPLEIVTSRQWYIRNGSHDAGLRDTLIERGRQLHWHPDFMRVRFEDWVSGLNTDWLVSRQRYFGVAFPIWYPVGPEGETDYDHPITADEADLPVDPTTDVPNGYHQHQRDQPGGFRGEVDIMDTWATSSCTPFIASFWEDDADLFSRVFPMDLRPQGHDIIRTWLFSTLLRSQLENGGLPWSDASVNGFIYDPDRKKMSKSKGNAVTPMGLLEEFGTDGFRYWATSVRPGMDAAFDTGQMKVGRRLAIKVLNASKFVMGRLGESTVDPDAVTRPIDRSLLTGLAGVVDAATSALEDFDFARALERTESFFWSFCDDYVELVKTRAYGCDDPAATASAQAALALALSTLIRLLAPFLPYVTEEVWSWWQEGSVHRAPWPTAAELGTLDGSSRGVLTAVSEVLAQVRKAKSEAGRSMRAPVGHLVVSAPADQLDLIGLGADDLRDAGTVSELELTEGEPAVKVELAPDS